MSTPMTAQEIGEAWLTYVTATFMLEDGGVRPEVQEEYRRMECNNEFSKDRELWRPHTDKLIEKILEGSEASRRQLFSETDNRSLAFVQDRVQCGTELLTALIQKGLKINLEGTDALPDFFRKILLQEPA